MKTRPLSTTARMIGLTSLLVLVLTLAYSSTPVKGNPGPEWVDFFSANTTFLGQPVPVGAVIAAFDPQGVQCGVFTVTTEGKYGLMPCYRDDDTTPEDDGADPGDLITFTINGRPAVALGPDDPIWTSHGARWEVDLDTDSDGDGVPDIIEGTGDRDGDGIPDNEDYDPTGYFYDQITGQIIPGGQIAVTGPGVVTIVHDGSSGYYAFITDGTAGIYTMQVTLPPDYAWSNTCLRQDPPPFDPTGGPNPTVLGNGEDGATGFLTSNACTDYYLSFDLAAADPFIFDNNFPIGKLFTLTVNKPAGDGTGTVISDPAGINCGADCTEDYVEGTVVTLTAHPGVKSYVEWSGDCTGTGGTAQVTMDADKTCIAAFGYPVGGIVVPVNKLELLAPWLWLAALVVLAALAVALVRRRRA